MKPKIKVLFVLVNLQGGGAERVLLNILRGLDSEKFEPTLLLFKREGAYWSDIPDHVRVVCATEGGKLRWSLPFILFALLREARTQDLVIGALELIPTYAAWICGRLLNKPTIGWVHVALDEYIAQEAPAHRLFAKFVYKRMKHLVFVSRGVKSSLIRLIGAEDKASWRVIYNPYDPLPFSIQEVFPSWASNVFAGDTPVLVAAGRLSVQKGFDLLIKAHAQLLKEGLNHHLLILGEGPLRHELEHLAGELGVKSTVFMPGFVNNPALYFRRSTLLVLSSRFEGLPTVIIEALAAGLPVVSADCPSGPKEILEDGRYGLLVAPGDSGALAKGVSELLRNSELRNRFSQLGPTRVDDFSFSNIMPQWESAILEAAGNKFQDRNKTSSVK